MAVEIIVDRAACERHGLCEQTAPQVCGLDDDGVVVLKHEKIDDSLQAAAEAGARVCPVAALSIRR